MAKRRMFSLEIVDTDSFLDMPASTQNLYFHLGMRADDDGFVSNPRKITTLVNCSTDDYKVLLAKGYIIPFDSGICVIRDWKINNYLRPDRYTPTMYIAEKQQYQSVLLSSGMTSGIPTDIPSVSTGKDRIDKDSIDTLAAKPQRKSKPFVSPTLDEVAQYISEKKLSVDPQSFIDYFEAADWHDSKGQKVKSWKQKLLTWNKGSFGTGYKAPVPAEPQEVKGIVHF